MAQVWEIASRRFSVAASPMTLPQWSSWPGRPKVRPPPWVQRTRCDSPGTCRGSRTRTSGTPKARPRPTAPSRSPSPRSYRPVSTTRPPAMPLPCSSPDHNNVVLVAWRGPADHVRYSVGVPKGRNFSWAQSAVVSGNPPSPVSVHCVRAPCTSATSAVTRRIGADGEQHWPAAAGIQGSVFDPRPVPDSDRHDLERVRERSRSAHISAASAAEAHSRHHDARHDRQYRPVRLPLIPPGS
jgi:hypothetical protein